MIRLEQRLVHISNRLEAVEQPLMGLLIAVLFAVVLCNLAFRTAGNALYWADEAAVYLMIWSALIGASLSVKRRSGISVRLLHEYLPSPGVHFLDRLVDTLVLICALVLLLVSWLWYDPVLLVRSGFDITEFKNVSYNFIYHEPSVSLAIQKFWLWLIMPITAITMSIHAGSNLCSAGAAARQAY